MTVITVYCCFRILMLKLLLKLQTKLFSLVHHRMCLWKDSISEEQAYHLHFVHNQNFCRKFKEL